MEKIIAKIRELNEAMNAWVKEAQKADARIAEAEGALKEMRNKNTAQLAKLTKKQAQFKAIESVDNERIRLKALNSELLRRQASLEEDQARMDVLEVEINNRLTNAKETERDVEATRARLREEVAKIEKLKKNYKEKVMQELVKKAI